MTGFALIFWIFLMYCVERSHRSRIERLEKAVEELRTERRVVLADEIDRLEWVSLSLPEGSHQISKAGVREINVLPVLTFIPKNQKVFHG